MIGLWIKRLVLRTVSTLKAAVLSGERSVLAIIISSLPIPIVIAIVAVSVAVSRPIHHASAILVRLALGTVHIIASASGKNQDA